MSKLKAIMNDVKNGTANSLYYLLSNNIEDTISKKGIKIRKFFSPLLRMIYRFQSEYTFKLESREPLQKTKTGKIFVVNHRQSDDMVFSAITIGKSGYFVFGNPILACESSKNGFGLWAYGMILLKRNDKENRKSCYKKMKYILENGGNVIIFSEGYWNLDDDGKTDGIHQSDSHNSKTWLIQDLNIGAFRLAQELKTEIIPVTLHYDELYGKKCYGKRGKTFIIEPQDDVFKKKDEFLVEMYTMYYSMMEKYSNYTIEQLSKKGINLEKNWQELKKELINSCDIKKVNYHLDLLDEKRIGKAKVINPVITEEEVYQALDSVELTKNNASILTRIKKRKL